MDTVANPQSGIGPEERAALDRAPAVVERTPSSYASRPDIWKNISPSSWNSFQWQWQNRIMTADAMNKIVPLTTDEFNAIRHFESSFSLCVSPHYAALMRQNGRISDAIRRQCIPSMAETESFQSLLSDPLGESRHLYEGCATRRYPDRALIYTTHECAMRCRHCTRRSKVGEMNAPSFQEIMRSIDAVCENPNIRDVLLSGGDALTLPTSALARMIERLRACPHIDVIRVCTRMPCTLPQRLNDPALLDLFDRFAPIYLNTQFNHPDEVSIESAQALKQLRKAGCILGNQSVLLNGVNTDPLAHEALSRWLLKNGCRPYYLFLCDVAQGTHHFRTPIQTGLDIMTHLRGRLSGLGIPHFVVDLPDGMGKVDLAPQRMTQNGDHCVTFKNWFGADVPYLDGI